MAVRQPWLSKLAGFFSRLRLILLLFYVVGMAAMPGLIAPAEGAVYTYAPHDRPWKPSKLRTMMARNMPAAHTIRSRALGCNGWLASGPTMNTLSALQTVGIIQRHDGCRWELLPRRTRRKQLRRRPVQQPRGSEHCTALAVRESMTMYGLPYRTLIRTIYTTALHQTK